MKIVLAFLAVAAFGTLVLPWLMFFKRMRKAFRHGRGWKKWRKLGLSCGGAMTGAFALVVLYIYFWPDITFTHMDGM